VPIVKHQGKRPDGTFVTFSKNTVNDTRLSWGARGILAHLLDKPPEWDVWIEYLVNQTADSARHSKRDQVMGMLAELKEHGYMTMQRLPEGGVSYTVHEAPVKPLPENPIVP